MDISYEFGQRVVAKSMDPSKPETYEWLDTFVKEMSGLFVDKYFHIGGDEVAQSSWQDEELREWAKKKELYSVANIQSYFNEKIFGILNKYERIPVGWDEIIHPNLPKYTVVQSWRFEVVLSL